MANPSASEPKTGLNILISGAGVAGPCLAWFLTQPSLTTPIHVTIVERAPTLRSAGQNIDIRGKAVDVVSRMGLLPDVRALSTTEEGLRFVDRNNKSKALFPVDVGGGSFTSEFEILREDLCKLFYEASLKDREGKIKYIFDDSIASITEPAESGDFGKGARVVFTNGAPPANFDIVVGADGLGSKVRRLAWPEVGRSVVKGLGQYTAFFTIPKGSTDSGVARWYNAPHRRCCMVRPDNRGTTRVFMSIMTEDPRVDEALKSGSGLSHEDAVKKRKALLRELFADAGWELERVLAGMDTADDFYMSEVAQIKMGEHGWSKGHVTLMGDAGFCPSPISGQGTSLAVIGAYMLAGEILAHPSDVKAALLGYERAMKPIVDKAQKLFPGAPGIANPETQWGISVFHKLLRTITLLKLNSIFGGGDDKPGKQVVPNYKGLPEQVTA